MSRGDSAVESVEWEKRPSLPSLYATTVPLTKRELFAAMAMQGLASLDPCMSEDAMAVSAVAMADSLIERLNNGSQRTDTTSQHANTGANSQDDRGDTPATSRDDATR